MGIVKTMRDLFSSEEDDIEELEEEGVDLPQLPTEPVASDAPAERGSKRGPKVLNINTTTQLQVVIQAPERFDDAVPVADHLNQKHTVVLNLESTNKDASRRILDFLSGVAYANNGLLKKVANCTYIITPYNVNVKGDLLDELESNGYYF